MSSTEKSELLPVMLKDGRRYVCNFLRFSGYYHDQEVYWCSLVTEEEPLNYLPGPFALLLCQQKQEGFNVVSDQTQISEILQHLDTIDRIPQDKVKPCDANILRYIVPLFRAAFPLKIHSHLTAQGLVFSNTSSLRTDLSKQVIHDTLAEVFNLYILLVRLCNFYGEFFLSQCDAYTKVASGCQFARGPIAEMQQGDGLPFMDYEQAKQWLEFASWQDDSEFYELLDSNTIQQRLNFLHKLNELTEQLVTTSKTLLLDPQQCEQQYADFKRFAAYELIFNDDAAFLSTTPPL